jgi:uracil-DNA glycosylase
MTEEAVKIVRLPVHPDARKSLAKLREEWRTCTACELGARREAVGGGFVFGEGVTRGLMFIGEGPGKDEEAEGRPFIGKSGQLLRKILDRLGVQDFYISNTVACRSCAPVTDAAGNPLMTRGYPNRPSVPKYQDKAPLKAHTEACRPRLMEEVYLVDPVVIVALGGEASQTLADKPVSIMKEHGVPREIVIPGAATIPSLTPKGTWVRKGKGVTNPRPTEQNEVRYLMIPTVHPAFVLRRANDFARDNPFKYLVDDIRQAQSIYDRYQYEVHGVVTTPQTGEVVVPYDLLSPEDD